MYLHAVNMYVRLQFVGQSAGDLLYYPCLYPAASDNEQRAAKAQTKKNEQGAYYVFYGPFHAGKKMVSG